MLAADYPFLNLFCTMMVFFGWIIWLVVLFMGPRGQLPPVRSHRLGEGGVDRLRDLRASDRRALLCRHAAAYARQGSRIGPAGPQELGRVRP
jgi:hypothetical protein